MKRSSWLDVLIGMTGTEHKLSAEARQILAELDDRLFEFWHFGEKILLAWTRDQQELRFLAIPHQRILEEAHRGFMNEILAGPKFLPPEEFAPACDRLANAAHLLRLTFEAADEVPADLVNSCVAKYGVTLVRDRAVVLLDIVGFSLHPPLEQVAMLKSLSYSVNSAYSQLISKDIRINFARTTTGDGFYIWNRARTRDANIALYKLMMLLLADNAVAQQKAAKGFPVPKLRAAFHIGEHYEFHEVEAPSPTTFSYIVGPVTIELARFIAHAPAEQIVIGDFNARVGGEDEPTRTTTFVEQAAASLEQLIGLHVADDHVASIQCYLTGPGTPDGNFAVASFLIRDKHGIEHSVFNAKINIHLENTPPIFLGIQHKYVEPVRQDA